MDNMNNNQFIREGNIIKGKVIKKEDGKIFLNINYKTEGIIPTEETNRYNYYDEIKEGDEIEVLVKNFDENNGVVIVSKIAADKRKVFNIIKNAYKEKKYVKGKVIRQIKGGFIVDLGANITAFLPMSHIKFFNDNILEKEVDLKILQIDEIRKNIVVSYKEYYLERQKIISEDIKKEFPLNEKVRVKIKEIRQDGLLVKKDEKEVFIHKNEILWNQYEKLEEKFILEQEIETIVINNTPEKLILSVKKLYNNPYKEYVNTHKQGEILSVIIKEILDDKMIVKIDEKILGVILKSEISYLKRITNIKDLYSIGEEIKALFYKYDEPQNIIYLSIKRMYENPWNKMEERYPPGAKVIGVVKKIIEGQGVEVELEENIDAFVYKNDISWLPFNKIEDIIKIGEKKEFKILNIDRNKFRLILGLKQLTLNPWNYFITKYKEGNLVEVKIIELDNNEANCQIIEGVNGKITLKGKNINIKKGDIIKVKIAKIEKENKKILLTPIEIEKTEEKREIDEYIKTHEHSFKINDLINFENVSKEEKK